MVVPDVQKATAVALVSQIVSPPSADSMWSVGLSSTGLKPSTHWISSGLIQNDFAVLLGDAAKTFAAYQAKGGTVLTLAQIQTLYNSAVIRSDAQGFEQTAIRLMGLKLTSTLDTL